MNHVHRPMARGHCGSGPKEIPTVDGENNVVAHRLHSQHTDVVLEQHGQNLFFETVEVRIHYVERHLNGIEREAVLGRGGQHFQMSWVSQDSGLPPKTLEMRTTVSGEMPRFPLTSSEWTGLLWPVKPMKRILPAFCASRHS